MYTWKAVVGCCDVVGGEVEKWRICIQEGKERG